MGCAVSRILRDRFPSPSEGDLSNIGARVASGAGLRGYARETGLDGRARLGRGEEGSGGREKDSIPAALLGAAYLDAGCPKVFGTAAALAANALEKGDFSPAAGTKPREILRRAENRVGLVSPPRRIGGATFSFYSRIWNAPTFPLPLHA